MGIVTAFLLGYLVGANAGREGYEEVITAAKAVRDSAEFDGLLRAVRSHASSTLSELGARLGADAGKLSSPLTLLDRVQDLMGRSGATSPGS